MLRSIPSDAGPSRSKLTLVGALAAVTFGAIGAVVILPGQIAHPPNAPIVSSELPKPAKRLALRPATRSVGLGASDLVIGAIGLEIRVPSQAKMEAENLLLRVLQQ